MPIRTPVSDFWMDPPWGTLTVNASEISFGYTDQSGKKRAYKVTYDANRAGAREAFHSLVWKLKDAMKGNYDIWRDPEMARNKSLLNIKNLLDKPEAEQMTLLASIDKIADSLEAKGFIREAFLIDKVADALENFWKSNKATIFFDEISNQGIDPMQAVKVLDIARKQGLRIE